MHYFTVQCLSALHCTLCCTMRSYNIISTHLKSYLIVSYTMTGKTMEYECSWIGQGERLVDSRRKNGASKKEDNKYIPLETMIELGLIKLVQVSYHHYITLHYTLHSPFHSPYPSCLPLSQILFRLFNPLPPFSSLPLLNSSVPTISDCMCASACVLSCTCVSRSR